MSSNNLIYVNGYVRIGKLIIDVSKERIKFTPNTENKTSFEFERKNGEQVTYDTEKKILYIGNREVWNISTTQAYNNKEDSKQVKIDTKESFLSVFDKSNQMERANLMNAYKQFWDEKNFVHLLEQMSPLYRDEVVIGYNKSINDKLALEVLSLCFEKFSVLIHLITSYKSVFKEFTADQWTPFFEMIKEHDRADLFKFIFSSLKEAKLTKQHIKMCSYFIREELYDLLLP